MPKQRIVGVIPAAGKGTRVAPLPGSKELFPIGFGEIIFDGKIRRYPKVVSQYLVDNMARAGAKEVYFVLGEGKLDIMEYYGDGQRFGTRIAYLMMDRLWGMPYTIHQAYYWMRDAAVIFGMPDTIFTPPDAFSQLLALQNQVHADLTLGLFRTGQPQRLSMVKFDQDNRVLAIFDKPAHTDLLYTWGIASWGPRFTELLHQELASPPTDNREIVLADIFQMAVETGLYIRALRFDSGEYIDIGTPEDLQAAVVRFSKQE
jgi:glucose-1-phosphate thymidylyltransferase